jgi:hypothetical protein
MSTRSGMTVEKFFRVTGVDSDSGVYSPLIGTGAPGGDAALEDSAEKGSLYQQTDGDGSLYQKKADGTGADKWKRLANTDDLLGLSFRKELVRAATGDADPGATHDIGTTPFTDDNAPLLDGSDFTNGEHIIYGVGGTPVLKKITNIVGDVLTLAAADDPMADNDNFVIKNYLPDSPDDQEKEALVHYNGSAIIKIADFNWNVADGISLTGSWAQQNGTVAANDTVEVAIEKLAGNQIDLTTLSGVAQGAVNLGTFTGVTIPDNSNNKEALQALETKIELIDLEAGGGFSQEEDVTTITTLDEVPVDDVLACEWELHMRDVDNPTRIRVEKVWVTHDGHDSADAVNYDVSVHTKLSIGPVFNRSVTIDLNGSGVGQTLRIRVASTETNGVHFTARRTDVRAPA